MNTVSTKSTFDGVRILVCADGDLCDGIGRGISRVRISVQTALIVAGELCLLTWAELPAVIKAAAKAERAGLDAAAIRASIRKVGAKKPLRHLTASERRNAKPSTLAGWKAHLEVCRAIRCKVCG